MNKLLKKIWKTFLLIALVSCTNHNDNTYFNGDIFLLKQEAKEMKNITLTPVVPLDGVNFGTIAVYDSLVFFWNPKLPDFFFNVFNVDTGAEIGNFCRKGHGPNEMIAVSPICQFFEEEKELKTLLFAAYNKKIIKWNISRSIQQSTTVIDTIIPYSCNEENMWACYDLLFLLDKDNLLVHVPSEPLNEEEATLPFYQIRTLYSNEKVKDYPIYKESIKNGEASIIPETFYNSTDAVKPDGSKIAQFMIRLQQLNIVDVEKEKVVGYRMEGSPDFSIFKKRKSPVNTKYLRAQADDQYIYASYWGKESWERKEIPPINTIHVFDWNGNWLQELTTNIPIHEIWLDRVRNRLYATNLNMEDIFYLDLNEIN